MAVGGRRSRRSRSRKARSVARPASRRAPRRARRVSKKKRRSKRGRKVRRSRRVRQTGGVGGLLGDIYVGSVAGSLESRRLRAAVVDLTCPNLVKNFACSLNSEGGPSKTPKFFPGPIQMTTKEDIVRGNGGKPDEMRIIERFDTNKNDTVLIIGQVCYAYFNTDCSLLNGIRDSKVYSQGGTTPKDFNISPDGVKVLVEECGASLVAIGTDECPRFDFNSKWVPLIAKYQQVAREIHGASVGAFLTSRTATMDGAFYRQFGLSGGHGDLVMKFEKKVAEKVKVTPAFASIAKKMDEIISHCDKNPNPRYEPPPDKDKKGGTEPVYTTLYEMWHKALNINTHPLLMPDLSAIILEVLSEPGMMGGINEYDGFTASSMLCTEAGAERPTAEEHYEDLMKLFDSGTCKPEWVAGLKKILQRGNLYVYHDVGLDPYVDDYIALKILDAAKRKHLAEAWDADVHR